MRTTLSIEDDLAQAIEQVRQRKNLSLKQCIDLLLRAGLQSVEKTNSERPYQGPVFQSTLRPGIDLNRLNQLNDELETEEFVAKQRASSSL